MEEQTFSRAKKLVEDIANARRVRDIIKEKYFDLSDKRNPYPNSYRIEQFAAAILYADCMDVFERFIKLLYEDMDKSISVWKQELKEL